MKVEETVDGKLMYLMSELQRLHQHLGLHEWIRAYEPWKKGEPYGVKCKCGVQRTATKAQFKEAEEDFSGSY